VSAGGARQPQPAGLDAAAAADGRQPEVERHERKAAVQYHLGGGQGLLQGGGAEPEQPREVHPGVPGGLRVEAVSQVHQGRGLADAGRRGEHREEGREAAARPRADQLDQLAARQPAF
jgi:hypothetical protein